MRVSIDHERCQLTGLCEVLAPDVFRLRGHGAELIDNINPEDHADDVADAIDSCPAEALRRAEIA